MIHLVRAALPLLACMLAAGCITTSPEQQAQRNAERCETRGYKPGTDDFKDCVLRIDGERAARMDARHREQVEKSAMPSPNRGY